MSHGFLRTPNGTFTTFDVPDATTTYPGAINSRGCVTGYAQIPHGAFYRMRNGTFTTFDVPDASATIPSAINPTGVITGYYTDASGDLANSYGFLRIP